ncbi:unnamed protein product [Closterium sp. NIES-53]
MHVIRYMRQPTSSGYGPLGSTDSSEGGAESEWLGNGAPSPVAGDLQAKIAAQFTQPGGAKPGGVELGGAASEGAESGVAEVRGTASSGGPRIHLGSGAAVGDTGVGGAGVTVGAGGTGGAAAAGPGGARTRGSGAAGTGGVRGAGAGDPIEPGAAGAGGAGAGGTRAEGTRAEGAGAIDPGAGVAGGTVRPPPYFVPLLQKVLGVPPSC